MEEHEFKIEHCTFEFECDAKWDEMTEVTGAEMSSVKHCGRCNKNVFRASSQQELWENILAKNCVAVESKLLLELSDRPESERRPMTLGMIKYEDEELESEKRNGFFSRLKNVLFR